MKYILWVLTCGLVFASSASAQERLDLSEGMLGSLHRYEADEVDYARPVSGTCSHPFRIETPKTVCSGSGCIGQDLCNDGTLTLVREELVVCECLHTCDWDDGSRRSTCAPCEGTKFYYEGVNSDELCEDHGGVADSQWYVTSYLKDVGLYTSPTSPPNSGYQPGNDEVTCECLSGTDETSCLDSDGPTTSTAPQICHDVCSTTKGTFTTFSRADINKDSPNCIEPEGDRGPETHCQCEDGPESVTWCTDDPSVCTDRGCVVHHTAPSSTRCKPVPSGGAGRSIECGLTFYVDQCATLGAIGFDVVYPAVGSVPGIGSDVECEVIPDGVLSAFNGLDEGLTAGLISLSGIPCPTTLVQCRFLSESPVTNGDFTVNTTDVSDVDGNPVVDLDVQLDVACVLPTTTTTTSTTTSTTSTSTTSTTIEICETYENCTSDPLRAALSWLFVAVGREDEAQCVAPLVD